MRSQTQHRHTHTSPQPFKVQIKKQNERGKNKEYCRGTLCLDECVRKVWIVSSYMNAGTRTGEVLFTTNARIFIFFFFLLSFFVLVFHVAHRTKGNKTQLWNEHEHWTIWEMKLRPSAWSRHSTHAHGCEYHLSHIKWCWRKHSTTIKWIFLLLSVIMRYGELEMCGKIDVISSRWTCEVRFRSLTDFFLCESRREWRRHHLHFIFSFDCGVHCAGGAVNHSSNLKSIESQGQFRPGPQLIWNK